MSRIVAYSVHRSDKDFRAYNLTRFFRHFSRENVKEIRYNIIVNTYTEIV